MSKGYCPYTTVAAVKAADRVIGPDRQWRPAAPIQAAWLKDVFRPVVPELPAIKEIVSNATFVAEEHVAFMRKNGWTAQLPTLRPGQFAAAACLDLLVAWKERGIKAPVKGEGGEDYPGVRIEKAGVDFFGSPSHDQPLCRLKTQSGDQVWLTMLEAAPDGVGIVGEAERLFRGQNRPVGDFEGLIFPMVDLYAKNQLDWLVGLSTTTATGQDAEVAEAVQQIKLKMNDEGARARAADEIIMRTLSVPRPPHIINKPFLVAFERPGLAKPLFAAHVTPEDWKDPGGLGL